MPTEIIAPNKISAFDYYSIFSDSIVIVESSRYSITLLGFDLSSFLSKVAGKTYQIDSVELHYKIDTANPASAKSLSAYVFSVARDDWLAHPNLKRANFTKYDGVHAWSTGGAVTSDQWGANGDQYSPDPADGTNFVDITSRFRTYAATGNAVLSLAMSTMPVFVPETWNGFWGASSKAYLKINYTLINFSNLTLKAALPDSSEPGVAVNVGAPVNFDATTPAMVNLQNGQYPLTFLYFVKRNGVLYEHTLTTEE